MKTVSRMIFCYLLAAFGIAFLVHSLYLCHSSSFCKDIDLYSASCIILSISR